MRAQSVNMYRRDHLHAGGGSAAEEFARFQMGEVSKLNPKIIETWINETLGDSEHLDISGVILKPEHKNPISRYGIDKMTLTNAGIPAEMVDRLYRALFVHSVGFYEFLNSCFDHVGKSQYSLVTNVWKVFAILLEFCSKSDYQMMISAVNKTNAEALERKDAEYRGQIEELNVNAVEMKRSVDTMARAMEELERQVAFERNLKEKVTEEMLNNMKQHEEEVALRLRFEGKLNSLHALYRNLDTSYKRATTEVDMLQKDVAQLQQKLATAQNSVVEVRRQRDDLASQLRHTSERRDCVERENTIKDQHVQGLAKRVEGLQDAVEEQKYQISVKGQELVDVNL